MPKQIVARVSLPDTPDASVAAQIKLVEGLTEKIKEHDFLLIGTNILEIDCDSCLSMPLNLLARLVVFTVESEAKGCSFLDEIRLVTEEKDMAELLERARCDYKETQTQVRVLPG